MDKYICGLNDKIVNIYIPRDGKFEVTEWSVDFDLLNDDDFDGIEGMLTVYGAQSIKEVYAVVEYNENYCIYEYGLMMGTNDRYINEDAVEIDKSQFSLIKMTITDDNGQQVLKTAFDNIIENAQQY